MHRPALKILSATLLAGGLAGCAGAPAQPDDGGYVENKTVEKTQRQTGRVEGRVDERVDQETDQAVDGVLDRLLKAIFD